jgi:hypothetical protein
MKNNTVSFYKSNKKTIISLSADGRAVFKSEDAWKFVMHLISSGIKELQFVFDYNNERNLVSASLPLGVKDISNCKKYIDDSIWYTFMCLVSASVKHNDGPSIDWEDMFAIEILKNSARSQ